MSLGAASFNALAHIASIAAGRERVEEQLPLAHARAAAALRQGTDGWAVDAVVAEAALRTRAAYLFTSDPDDMNDLINRGTGRTVVVTV